VFSGRVLPVIGLGMPPFWVGVHPADPVLLKIDQWLSAIAYAHRVTITVLILLTEWDECRGVGRASWDYREPSRPSRSVEDPVLVELARAM
jgi:hypothetical protein